MEMAEVWKTNLNAATQLVEKCLSDSEFMGRLYEFSRALTDLYRRDGNLYTCGNGGSHCDAMHFAEELTGRYQKNRRPLGALALGDMSHMSCVANDFGFDQVFSRQLEGLANKQDLFVGISTSGNSKNVIEAVKVAKNKGLFTVALTGQSGGALKGLVDLAIHVPSDKTDRIQELHIKIIHNVIQTMERELFPENY